MKHELEQLDFAVSITGSVESFQNDVNLIEQFLVHANGCGLESLDSPAGRLIESGLATRYSNHFKVGSGLEGLGELVGKLKKGIEGLRKRFGGKLPAELKKAARDLEEVIKKTYGNDSWYTDKHETGKTVSTVGLAKLVGNVKSTDDISSAPATAFKLYDAAINDHVNKIKAYIAETHNVVDQLNKLGDDEEALKKYASEQSVILKPKLESLNLNMDVKSGVGVTDLKLSKEQCIAIGAEMASIVNWFYNELIEFDPECHEVVGDPDLDNLSIVDIDAVGKLYYDYLHWEPVLAPGEKMYANCAGFMKDVLIQMEALVITALK